MKDEWIRFDELTALFGAMAAEAILAELEAHLRARAEALSGRLPPDLRWSLALAMSQAMDRAERLEWQVAA